MKKNSILALLPVLLFGAYRFIAKKPAAIQKKNEEYTNDLGLAQKILPVGFVPEEKFDGIKIPNKYFETEDAAILYLFENLKNEDIPNALGCFSTINTEDDISFVDKILFNGRFNLNCEFPLEYKAFKGLNEISVLNERAAGILGFVSSLILNEDNPINYLNKNGKDILVENLDEAEIAFDNLDTKYMKTIDVLDINVPNSYLMESKTSYDYFRRTATLSGALDKTERTVLFSYKNKQYFVSFTLIKYESGWKIENFGAELSFSTPPGFFICYRTSKDDYFELIK